MSQDILIALEVRLYEDVLYKLHVDWRLTRHPALASSLKALIRRFEAKAHEVTWPGSKPVKPWYERESIVHEEL